MSVGPLSPGTRRRLLQGQTGPLPAPLPSSVAIFISSTVSGKGQGRAGLGGDKSAGTPGRGAKWPVHGSEGPLGDLGKNAAWPVTHMELVKGSLLDPLCPLQ